MSGHSKWHSIKYKKGAADAKRGKIFTKHAKLIFIVAKEGGADPEMNPGLRTAIANAKADNVPNANIDKAIKKASGEGKDAVTLEEVMYEGFGPNGTTFYIQVITDNKNRAHSGINNCFNKNGGNMGEAGTVGWMFERKGMILAKAKGMDNEEAELSAIDAGAEDLTVEGDEFEIMTAPTALMGVKSKLEQGGFSIVRAEITYLPKNTVKIDSLEDAKKVLKLMDVLEDEDDVSNVYSNFDIPDELMEKI